MTARAATLVFVIGTRPAAIKLAPVARPPRFEARVLTTSQHREMLDPILGEFGTTRWLSCWAPHAAHGAGD